MRRIKSYKRPSKLREIIIKHMENNLGLYIFLGVVFLIGIALGIFFINSLSEGQEETIKNYICEQINHVKFEDSHYLKALIVENILWIIGMWLAGIIIVGIIINYVILIYKGFCIGYTISAITISIGADKALLFIFSGMFLQNILLIPALIGTAVSGMRFFKEIFKNRDKETLILGIIRHTLFSTLMGIIAISAAFTEIFISNQILKMVIKYII